ncbi:CapA family protein, partial [Adlercreutzia sp. ZJ473]|uniref:CapA family protein n=1 Tax=Adlercreutzia sp. ZJ473 TaxID=2722822 RepID=UPI0020A65A7B
QRSARPAPTAARASSPRPRAQAAQRALPIREPGALPVRGLVILVALIAAAVLLFSVGSCAANALFGPAPAAAPEAAASEQRVSFAAVGDNLPEANAAAYADVLAGEAGDGLYDYAPIYANVKPLVEAADLAYVKQETHLGGDEIGPRGWPSFNTTDAMADAIVATGFDLVASASNHAYDWGAFGAVEHSRSVWNAQPVAFTGTASSAEEAAQLATVEREGITFALLDYTYGVNGFEPSELPAYAVNFIDEERIRADVAAAHEAADVVLVAMHWGTENLMEADDEQQRLAKLLADLEVDVVLGSHPHVIGPLEWVEGETGHQALVAYSLGNFLSHHDTPHVKNELEGMLTCDFVRDAESGDVRVENAAWTPLVNHTDEDGSLSIYPLGSYTPELATRHTLLGQEEDPLGQLNALTDQTIGDKFPINR